MSERGTSLRPARQPQQVVCSLCRVCLLALAVAWVIGLNMKSKTDEAREGARIHACMQTHTLTGLLFTIGASLSQKHSCSQRSCCFSSRSLLCWISGTEGWINRKSMQLHGVRMQGYFTQLRQVLLLVSGAYRPSLRRATWHSSQSPLMLLELDSSVLNPRMLLDLMFESQTISTQSTCFDFFFF